MRITAQQLFDLAQANVRAQAHTELQHASATQMHNALGTAVMTLIAPDWMETEEKRRHTRKAAYLSAEYLTGRLVYNNLLCLGILKETRTLFAQKGAPIEIMEDIEDDAFGNGGLGRLAACFLDSAAVLNVPLAGYGLRYRYGLFRQTFQHYRQTEAPDDWSRFGDPWSIRRDELSVIIPIAGHPVRAVPYDMPVIGYENGVVGTLRLWQTESLHEIDFVKFNEQKYAAASRDKNTAEDIVKFLYPNDTTRAGKLLRLRQQYVLSSASLQDMLRAYKMRFGSDYSHFAEQYAVQLNDTHPTLSIPELIRLLSEDGVDFETAFQIARQTFAFTNHTVMQEALEKWDVPLLHSLSPILVEIIRRIDERLTAELKKRRIDDSTPFKIIENNRVHMARLAVYATHATNGVAELHTEILKKDLFKDWYALYPERFQNKTNGITQRRWLGLCNEELTALLEQRIGTGFLTDLERLSTLRPLIDERLAEEFILVKQKKKRQLSALIEAREGIRIPEHFLFDVQIKRLHEYKRQLLNALSILAIYDRLKAGELKDFAPTAFIFGAKAAPGYDRAKAIIRFINQIAAMVNGDSDTNDRLLVVFVQNYDCSYAEKIIPAADVSEQISPAGTEASGTGNMKLTLNGAVTLGTMDGANIEIVESAGLENNYIFGATVQDIARIKDTYDPNIIYHANPALKKAMDRLIDGSFEDADGRLAELYDALLKGASWHKPDHYYLLLDFDSYMQAKLRANRDYQDKIAFAEKCLYNIAGAGKFSSDRTIRQYADDIWHVQHA